ncbi:MAG: T9SS type A sorting domain-containing protein [Bacteroidetes bacterium]|nr:T9SS type A sorting domain-containing protein [Bacteroidota bacterium]
MKKNLVIILLLLGTLVHGQITIIPDSNFEQALIDLGIDSDGVINGQVLTSDVEGVVNLAIWDKYIVDLTGIQDFAALEELDVHYNLLTSLDLSQNMQLRILYCGSNDLSSLDLSNNILLETLYCGNPSIDVGPFNTFTSLDLSSNTQLRFFDSDFAYWLETINFGQNPNLEEILAYYCSLSSINFDGIPGVRVLKLGDNDPWFKGAPSNNFTAIDLSGNPNITALFFLNMYLEQLNVQNGNNAILTTLDVQISPELSCIQVDDEVAANNNEPPYNGWLTDSGVTYSEDCTLGIEDFQDRSVTIFPNPAADILNIDLQNDAIVKEIRVYDALGRLVISVGADTSQLDVSTLSPGLYLVQVKTNQGVLIQKMIKE